MSSVEQIPFASWPDFKAGFMPALFGEQTFRAGKYFFRGVGDSEWQLESSFDRRYRHLTPAKRSSLWRSLVELFHHACKEAGVDRSITEDEAALLALGQHNGLPTRLLDWTSSPYIAAFFAFRNALFAVQDPRARVAIWALDAAAHVWGGDFGVQLVRPAAEANSRLRRQAGCFTYIKSTHMSLESYIVEMDAQQPVLSMMTLPASAAIEALPDLDAMGLNAAQLFPDFSGVAEAATLRAAYNFLLNE
jgi:FRG domain